VLPRPFRAAAALCAAGLLAAGPAAAAPTGADPQPTAPTTAPGTTTAPGGTTTAPAPAQPPRLSSLRLPRVATAQQGHAQILVGARTSAPARLRVQIVAAATRRLVRTVTAAETHAAGRVYFLIEATSERRYQLPAGVYEVTVQATDAQGRASNVLRGTVRLRLTEPRGRLDAYTVPLWPSLARQFGVPPGGQLVAAVAPGGAAVAAGIRRGDVITSLGGISVATPGGLARALRALPAGRAVPVELVRDGRPLPGQITPKPDWEPVADLGRSLAVVVRRDPTKLAYAYAYARQQAEAGDPAAARRTLEGWRPAWRVSAAAHLLSGDLLYAENETKQALGAYNRARAADPDLTAAHVGRGLALAARGRAPQAAAAFARAAALDPADASVQALRAYALLRAGKENADRALDAANRAVALDRRNEEGHIARGLALLALGRRADGVVALRRGLLLLSDPDRARQIIRDSLEPNDP
jgi:tetratricopeptide (TPR) repeat protein